MEGDMKQFSLVNFDYGVPFTFTEKIFNADEVTWKKYSKSLFKSAKKLLQYMVLGPDERDVNECFLS